MRHALQQRRHGPAPRERHESPANAAFGGTCSHLKRQRAVGAGRSWTRASPASRRDQDAATCFAARAGCELLKRATAAVRPPSRWLKCSSGPGGACRSSTCPSDSSCAFECFQETKISRRFRICEQLIDLIRSLQEACAHHVGAQRGMASEARIPPLGLNQPFELTACWVPEHESLATLHKTVCLPS